MSITPWLKIESFVDAMNNIYSDEIYTKDLHLILMTTMNFTAFSVRLKTTHKNRLPGNFLQDNTDKKTLIVTYLGAISSSGIGGWQ